MKPIIEFCISNLASGTQEVMAELEKDPDLDVIEYGCLSYCGMCSRNRYALVNGDMVVGDTNEELINNIYQHLDENPMF